MPRRRWARVEDLKTVLRACYWEMNMFGAIYNLEQEFPLILGLSLSPGPMLRLLSVRPLEKATFNTAGAAPRSPTPSSILIFLVATPKGWLRAVVVDLT
jgi:hypothetical protein